MNRDKELVELYKKWREDEGVTGKRGAAVSSPPHYVAEVDPLLAKVRRALVYGLDDTVEKMECFVAMVNALDNVAEIRGYLRGNSFKYRWRYPYKNGVEDLQKAQWYEERLMVLERTVNNYESNVGVAAFVAQSVASAEEYGGESS